MTAPPLTALREFVVRVPAASAGAITTAVKKEIAAVLVADTRRRFVTGTDPGGRKWLPLKRKRPDGGDKPLLDTGLLRASVQAEPTPTGVVLFSALKYSRLHQDGGTVRARAGKYLAIPLTREAKRAGSPRRFRAKLSFRPFRRKRTGGVLYSPPRSKGEEPTDQYILVPSYRVPARPFLGASEQAMRVIDDIVAEATAKALPRQ